MGNLDGHSKEELETLKLVAEIEKLRAETASTGAPKGFIDRFALPIAAVVGGLSGLAALLSAWVQTQEIDTINSQKYMDALKAQEYYQQKLQESKDGIKRQSDELSRQMAKYKSLRTDFAGMKSSVVADNTKTATPAMRREQQIDLFVFRGYGPDAEVSHCSELLSQKGYFVRSVNRFIHGPKYDKIIYFWQEDVPAVKQLQLTVAACGMKVPDANLILVDPNTDYQPGKIAPRKAFEVWTSGGPQGTG